MARIKAFLHSSRQPVLVTLLLLILCGFVFPFLLSGLSEIFFPHQAHGSLVEQEGKVVGAHYVGQEFSQPYFMKGRPSAVHYNTFTTNEKGEQVYLDGTPFGGVASGSQNLAPSSPALKARVEKDMALFLEQNPDVRKEDIPTDLLTASGSGLDPHISPASAKVQLPAISQASGLSMETLEEIVKNNTTHKVLGIFGEETVNVLGVNMEIDRLMKKAN